MPRCHSLRAGILRSNHDNCYAVNVNNVNNEQQAGSQSRYTARANVWWRCLLTLQMWAERVHGLWLLAVPGLLLQVGCAQFLPSSTNTPHPTPTCTARAAAEFSLLGELRWDDQQSFAGTRVGGLSSIDYDAASGLFFLVSDDRSTVDPARAYTARIRYDVQGLHEVTLQELIWLKNSQQQRFASPLAAHRTTPLPDAEALRLLPASSHMLWTDEGDFAQGTGPQLIEADKDGRWLRTWPLPSVLQLPHDITLRQGPRRGYTLEGMSLSPDGKTLWLSMERALWQDLQATTAAHQAPPIRITALDTASRQPLRQLAYAPDALPKGLWLLPGKAMQGVSDILADGPEHLLVLERSYAPQRGFAARIYRTAITPTKADNDVLALPQLTPGNHHPIEKVLVADLGQLGLRSVDNLEGMSWGPPLASGERVLLLVSDNNFNPAQVTQFVALVQRQCGPATGL